MDGDLNELVLEGRTILQSNLTAPLMILEECTLLLS